MTNIVDRKFFEKATATQLAVNRLDGPDLELWKECKAGYRALVWLNRELKIYNNARTFGTVMAVDCDADFEQGLGVKLAKKEDPEQTMWCDHIPQRLFEYDIFVWVPYLPEVRYVDNGRGSPMSLSFPLQFRSMHSITYINDKHQFIETME